MCVCVCVYAYVVSQFSYKHLHRKQFKQNEFYKYGIKPNSFMLHATFQVPNNYSRQVFGNMTHERQTS